MSESEIDISGELSENQTFPQDFLSQSIQTLGLEQIQRHLFLCADQTKPKCCSKAAGLEAWDYLKRRLKELELDQPTPTRPSCIFRTKANCLRVCHAGPILVVYPDGIWYGQVTPEVIERIIQEHLIDNKIVKEYAFLTHPLPEISLEHGSVPLVQASTESTTESLDLSSHEITD